MSEWGKVPRDAFMDKRLTRLDLQVLGILCAHANGRTGICTRRQEAIADEVEAARESVNRSMKKLVKLGYVAAKARPGMKRSLEYRVLVSDGTAGQLSLFEAQETPREAKPVRAKRDRKITSVVMPEVTSVVTSSITSNEQTLVNRSWAEARERDPANDDEPSSEPSAPRSEPFEAGPVPARSAEVVVLRPERRTWSRADSDALEARLFEAGEGVLDRHDVNGMGLRALTEPLGWIDQGCDLDLDILPTIAGIARRHRGRPVRSWNYFAEAVREARDRRRAAGQQTSIAIGVSSREARERGPPRRTGDDMADAFAAIARGEPEAQRDMDVDDGRTIDGTARRI